MVPCLFSVAQERVMSLYLSVYYYSLGFIVKALDFLAFLPEPFTNCNFGGQSIEHEFNFINEHWNWNFIYFDLQIIDLYKVYNRLRVIDG